MKARRSWAIALVALALAACAGTARAQRFHSQFPVTDGGVASFAFDSDRIYVSGDFGMIGTPNGCAAVVDTSSGDDLPGFPEVHGVVYAAIRDGEGGWYIGGSFDRVGDQLRSNLARIRSDFSIDTWQPRPNAAVRALQRVGHTLFAGGDFTNVNGYARAHLAALDATTGKLRPWNLDAGGTVRAITLLAGSVFVGGDFTTLGGQVRHRLALVDGRTGAVMPWAPDADGAVRCLAIDGRTVYAGGDFLNVSGTWRHRLAAIDADDATVTSWNGTADGPVTAIAVAGGKVYVGGDFTHVGGALRTGIAALSKRWWQALDWGPPPFQLVLTPGVESVGRPIVNHVTALSVVGDRVYVAGTFEFGRPRCVFATFDTTVGQRSSWTPRVNGVPRAIVPSDSRVFIGGDWSLSGGEPRNGFAAIDRITERVLPWQAPIGWGPIAARNGRIYCATSNGLVAVDAADGHVVWTQWLTYFGMIALALDDSTVYSIASYHWSNTGDANVYAHDAATGRLRWHRHVGDSQPYLVALVAQGDRVYVGGSFHVDGSDAYGFAALRSVDGSIIPVTTGGWRGILYKMAGAAGGTFIAASDLVRYDTASGITTTVATDVHVSALGADSNRVCVAGSFTSFHGEPRHNLACIDARTGTVLEWQPYFEPAGIIRSLAIQGGTVYGYASGSIDINGERRDGLFAIDAPTSPLLAVTQPAAPAVRLAAPWPNPIAGLAHVAFELPRAQVVTLELLDVAGRQVAMLAPRAEFGPGRHELELDARRLAAGVYWLRLTTGDDTLTRKVVRL